MGGAREQQQIVPHLLGCFLDAEQKWAEEVGLFARKGRFVGEHAQNAVETLGHAARDRVGNVPGFANGLLDAVAGLLGNATFGAGGIVEHEGNRCLAHSGQLRNVPLCQAFPRPQKSPPGILMLLMRISS